MGNVSVSREIQATPADVWEVLADFPNIAAWNSGIKYSGSTSDKIEGVGAQRHCDLSPAGALEETVVEWEPSKKMVISIDSTAKLPIRTGLATFNLEATDDSAPTTVTINYDYDLKWGIAGKAMGTVLPSQLTKGFGKFLADLEAAATASD